MPRPSSQVLGGKYRLVRKLGSGGMGTVWHAEHLTLNSPVALKLIEPAARNDPEALSRFLREARTAAALRSPHVVQILDYGVDADRPYIAMELLEGESLAERLARVGRLSSRDSARVIQHIARAIARAHAAGIVHRDLKPENVFIVQNDDEEIVKVLDFGIAKATLATLGVSLASTRAGALLGTPLYMSPEQAEGIKALDHRTDIWALGVIAFKCLLGKPAFNGDTLGSLILAICSRPLPVPSRFGPVPAGFDAWFARACAREPGERFGTAKQAAVEFKRLCGEAGTALFDEVPFSGATPEPKLAATTGQVANSELLTRPRRASRLALMVAGILAAVTLGAVVAFALRGRAARPSAEQLAQPLVSSVATQAGGLAPRVPPVPKVNNEEAAAGPDQAARAPAAGASGAQPSLGSQAASSSQSPGPGVAAPERPRTLRPRRATAPPRGSAGPGALPSKHAVDLGI